MPISGTQTIWRITIRDPSGFASVRRALESSHLDVAYQPQILAGSRTLCGIEALVQWRDPERDPMPTTELIRLAEDAGLIGGITNDVLGTAMSQVMEWQRAGLIAGVSLAVNVSGVELRDMTRHLETLRTPATAEIAPPRLDRPLTA
jgi:EAL domain-containing protein (putative c-di-GMP-specific phosphodiesterase class I)